MANQASGNLSGTVIQAETINHLVMQVDSGRYRVGNETPPVPRYFIDREPVHKWMDEVVARARATDTPPMICLHGPGGVGATVAMAKWIRQHQAEFPDGAVYVKLSDPERRSRESAGEALGAVLRKLGVPPGDLQATTEDRAAQLRAWCGGKKVSLMLDDVANAAQLAYFRPTDSGCVLLATSRWRPDGLGPDFHDHPVPALTDTHAHQLVAELLADHGKSVTSEESAVIVRAAKGFPIAIELMVSRLLVASDRQRVRFVRRLADHGWEALGDDEKLVLNAHLDIAYEQLAANAAAAYRALAAHPGGSFEVGLAEQALGGDPDDAADALDSLCRANLLTIDDTGRCHFHDLAHAHARSKAGETDPDLAWRIVDWYLKYTVAFDRVLSNRPRSGPLYQRPADVVIQRVHALAWLERERVNLAGAVALAEAAGHDDLVWQLCEALWGLYHLHGHYEDWITTHEMGLKAAQRLGHAEAEMRMASQLGSACLGVGELDRARECFRLSHDVAASIGHRQGQESALEWLGKIALRDGDAREALGCFDLAWKVADDDREFALLRLQCCRALLVLGEFAVARDEIMAAWQHFQPIKAKETDNKAKCQLELGRALTGLGEIEAARAAYLEAERLFAEDGSERQRKVAEGLRRQLDSEQE